MKPKHWIAVFTAALAIAAPALAQRDFLTNDEIEKVREAQDPSQRLNLYLLFARQRLDQLQRLLEKDKKGRSLMARELLEDYSRIIEAIDTVSDDALKRKVDVAEGHSAVGDAEKRFLNQLQKIKDKAPSDLDLYDIALKEAIATTSDSMELAKEDLGKRGEQLSAEEERAKTEREQVLAAEDAKNKPAEVAGNSEASGAPKTAEAPKRKPPTLYRKGEDPNQPTPGTTTPAKRDRY